MIAPGIFSFLPSVALNPATVPVVFASARSSPASDATTIRASCGVPGVMVASAASAPFVDATLLTHDRPFQVSAFAAALLGAPSPSGTHVSAESPHVRAYSEF